jgi:hypothetical protein
MRLQAYWFTQHEQGGFPVEQAALGSCDLSVLHVGGEWQWLVRQAGRDVGEGKARAAVDLNGKRKRSRSSWGDFQK